METPGSPEAPPPEDPYRVFLRLEGLAPTPESRELFDDAYIGHFPSEQMLDEHFRDEAQLQEFRDHMMDGMRLVDIRDELYTYQQPDGSLEAFWKP